MATDVAEASRRGQGRRNRELRLFPVDQRSGASMTRGLSDALRALAEETRTSILRSAAFAGATVLYDELNLRVPVKMGRLKAALYRYHVERLSGPDRQVYDIGVNKVKAPHWYNVEYGHLITNVSILVNGRWIATTQRRAVPFWVQPRPYLRPTADARLGDAVNAMFERMVERWRELGVGVI